MITELVRDPQPYFQERIKYPRLRYQTLIVVLVGLAANVWNVSLFFTLGAAATYVESALLLLTAIGVIEFVAWWVVLTGVMQIIANVLGGDANYGRLLRLTGYGFLPMIVSGAIWSVTYFLSLQGLSPPDPPEVNSFEYTYQSYSQFLGQTAGDPVLLAGITVGSLFILGSGYLWLRGVSVAADLEDERAGAAAGAAVLILLVRVFIPIV
jgi:hypothetical protein